MISISRTCLRSLGLAAVALLAIALPTQAAITLFEDDFEAPTHTAGSAPANSWTTGLTSANQTVLVVDSQQSAFGPGGDTQSLYLDDNDNDSESNLGDARFSHALSGVPIDKMLIFEFDFMVHSGNQQPRLSLQSGGTDAIIIEMRRFGGELGYRNSSNGIVTLTNNVYDMWYHVVLNIHPLDQVQDTYDLHIESFDGLFSTTLPGLDFVNDVSSLTTIFSRTLITAGTSGTEYAVDNFNLAVVPTPAAMPAGLALLGTLLMRRRAH